MRVCQEHMDCQIYSFMRKIQMKQWTYLREQGWLIYQNHIKGKGMDTGIPDTWISSGISGDRTGKTRVMAEYGIYCRSDGCFI